MHSILTSLLLAQAGHSVVLALLVLRRPRLSKSAGRLLAASMVAAAGLLLAQVVVVTRQDSLRQPELLTADLAFSLAWLSSLGLSWLAGLFLLVLGRPHQPDPSSASELGTSKIQETATEDTSVDISSAEVSSAAGSSAAGSGAEDSGTEDVETEDLRPLADLLYRVTEAETLYLDTKLTLTGLAEHLGLSRHRVSEAINKGFGINYHDFVNSFRVRAAQRLLRRDEGPQLSVLDIAYEVGFNSSATFYRAFKRHTGLTPTAFVSSPESAGHLSLRPRPLERGHSPAISG